MRTRIALLVLALVGPFLVASPGSSVDAPAPGRLVLEVVSNRADLVSAGDVLVAVRLPRGVRPRQVRVTADGRDVTRRFAVRPDGRFLGLVDPTLIDALLVIGISIVAIAAIEAVRFVHRRYLRRQPAR